jgi:uncharacterized iron-regulated protein
MTRRGEGRSGRLWAALLVSAAAVSMTWGAGDGRCALWVDMYSGEPVLYGDLLGDLVDVEIVYLGEKHTLERHHRLQERILTDLASRKPAVLALEQLTVAQQPQVDRYNAGEIDFEELAEQIGWAETWPRYEQYRGLVETAHQLGASVIGLNAPRGIVRQVARQGLEGLEPEQREELPRHMQLDDPMYRRHMETVLSVHAHVAEHPGMIQTMFEAQVARDETMAQALVDYLASEEGEGRQAIVVTGSGHVEHAMGMPSRVRRRMPAVVDRIVVMSDSGDVQLSDAEMMAANEEFSISHADLRHLQRPLADYLHVIELRPEPAAAEQPEPSPPSEREEGEERE